jgi:hypothetical protein
MDQLEAFYPQNWVTSNIHTCIYKLLLKQKHISWRVEAEGATEHGKVTCYHVYGWLKTVFGLVIGIINNLQVVTTNNEYTVADLHNVQSLHTNLFSLSALVFTGTVTVSLNYTLQILRINKVKSSQADFLYSSSTTNSPWLSSTENWLVLVPNKFCHSCSQGTDTN